MSNLLPTFKLEEYLSTREFNTKYMFGNSDTESFPMSEIVQIADEECKKLWNSLYLSYTEPCGYPLLLEEISKQYDGKITKDNIFCFAGAQEGIYATCHCLLEPQDHVIVITPCYQSLESIPNSMSQVTHVDLSYDQQWKLDLNKVKEAIRPNTKLLIINFPHNPTGALITDLEQQELIKLARLNNAWIFSDEVYRFLELDPQDRLPPIASIYEKGLSLGVMSKSFGLPGLRIGWIATQDLRVLQQLAKMKHYLSICNSAPSEILALIALRNQEKILMRNLNIMHKNIELLDEFMHEYCDQLEWVRPKGGCIGFPKLKLPVSSYEFCERLRESEGVLMLPGTVYGLADNHFRLGFGRKNMPEALNRVKNFIKTI